MISAYIALKNDDALSQLLAQENLARFGATVRLRLYAALTQYYDEQEKPEQSAHFCNLALDVASKIHQRLIGSEQASFKQGINAFVEMAAALLIQTGEEDVRERLACLFVRREAPSSEEVRRKRLHGIGLVIATVNLLIVGLVGAIYLIAVVIYPAPNINFNLGALMTSILLFMTISSLLAFANGAHMRVAVRKGQTLSVTRGIVTATLATVPWLLIIAAFTMQLKS